MTPITSRLLPTVLVCSWLPIGCGASQKDDGHPKVHELSDQPPVEYETPPAQQKPAAETPAVAPGAPHLELAEMTVMAGTTPQVKIHADGTSEIAKSPTAWEPGPSVKPDGTISVKGQDVARVNADGSVVKLPGGQALPVKITADALTVDKGGKQVGLALEAGGALKVIGEGPKGPAMRVEGATTPGQRKAVLSVLALLFSGGQSAPAPKK